jgi:hypothetical protein
MEVVQHYEVMVRKSPVHEIEERLFQSHGRVRAKSIQELARANEFSARGSAQSLQHCGLAGACITLQNQHIAACYTMHQALSSRLLHGRQQYVGFSRYMSPWTE